MEACAVLPKCEGIELIAVASRLAYGNGAACVFQRADASGEILSSDAIDDEVHTLPIRPALDNLHEILAHVVDRDIYAITLETL